MNINRIIKITTLSIIFISVSFLAFKIISKKDSVIGASTVLTAPQGGTGLSSYTRGDILFATSTNIMAKVAVGSANQLLSVSSGIPSWTSSPTVSGLSSTGVINGTSSTFSGNVTSTTMVVKGNVNSVFSVQKTDGTEIFRVRTGGTNQTKLYLDENNILINQAGTGNGKLVMGTANGIAVVGSDVGGVLWLQVETYTQSSGDTPITVIRPTINQSGTAGYAILDINPTITAEGSGSKHLLRIRKGSGSNFLSLTSAGVLNVGESAGVSTFKINGGRSMTVATSTSASLDFGNSAAAGTQQLTATVSGATTSMACQVAQSTLQARTDEMYSCYVSAADTVSVVRGCYAAAGCGDPAAATTTIYVNN